MDMNPYTTYINIGQFITGAYWVFCTIFCIGIVFELIKCFINDTDGMNKPAK